MVSEEEDISRATFGALLGPIRPYLEDPAVLNIDINENGTMWIERFGGEKFAGPEKMEERRREALICHLANREDRSVGRLSSRLACDMPYYDARVQAFAPPVSNWPLMIRRHAARIFTLDEYVEKGIISTEHRMYLAEAIGQEANIIVAGRMGSGKTTFLNACMHEAAHLRPDYRCVIIQDRAELKPSAPNHLSLYARVEQGRYTDGELTRYIYDFPDLLEDALRSNAQYLVWGELRDGQSAFGLLMALNTGTRGFLTTIHADSAYDTLARLEDLLRLARQEPVRRMIARFVNVIVFMDRDDRTGRRFVRDIISVNGIMEDGGYLFESIASSTDL
jgi:type IV secretion system protein TrbB